MAIALIESDEVPERYKAGFRDILENLSRRIEPSFAIAIDGSYESIKDFVDTIVSRYDAHFTDAWKANFEASTENVIRSRFAGESQSSSRDPEIEQVVEPVDGELESSPQGEASDDSGAESEDRVAGANNFPPSEIPQTDGDEGVTSIVSPDGDLNNGQAAPGFQPTEVMSGNRDQDDLQQQALAELLRAAEQQAREEARNAEIDALVDERTRQYILKLGAEGKIANNDDHLTVIRFEKRPRIMQYYPTVVSEAQRLRQELQETGLSDADAARLQNLVAYETTLQSELDRIRRDEEALVAENVELQSDLDAANAIIVSNSDRLNALNFDWNQFTVPNVSVDGTDWSDYRYELPPFPGQDPFPPAGSKIGFITAAAALPESTFLLTKGATGDSRDLGSEVRSRDASLEFAINEIHPSDYQHLSFGPSSIPTTFVDDQNLEGDQAVDNVWWLLGNATSREHFLSRTGTATWSGELYGDYALRGSDQVFLGAVTGTIGFRVDFSDYSVAGEMASEKHYTRADGISVSRGTILYMTGDFMLGDELWNTTEIGAGISTDLVSVLSTGSEGASAQGGVGGAFFGPEAQEFGGTFWYFDEDGGASGLVVAKEGTWQPSQTDPTGPDGGPSGSPGEDPVATGPMNNSNLRGVLAYKGFLQDPDAFAELGEPVAGFVGVERVTRYGETAFVNTGPEVGAFEPGGAPSTDQFGDYSYVQWGSWDRTIDGAVIEIDGQYVADSQADWLVYDPTTDLPTSGSASYRGTVAGSGRGMAGGEVSGNIELDADFGTDRITGSMNLRDASNASWADAAFDTSIRRGRDETAGFEGNLTGADVNSGGIFGGFAGPNAEEVGGGWQLDHVDGSGANGIFRAQQ